MRPVPRRRQRGQAALFGAIVAFAAALTVVYLANLGAAGARRLEAQHAADAAAFAGAQVEADALSAISWINDALACLWYRQIRSNVDVAVFGVLRRLKETGPPYPPDAVVGIADAPGRHEEALAEADLWLPRTQEWLDRLGRIQKALALAAPVLLEREIYTAALAGEADLTALFPAPAFFPEPDAFFALNLQRLGDDHWRFWTDDFTYLCEVTRRPPENWTIQVGDLTIMLDRLGPDDWRVQASDGTDTLIHRLPGGGVVRAPGEAGVQVTSEGGITTIRYGGRTIRLRRAGEDFEQDLGDGHWTPVGGAGSIDLGNGHVVRVDLDPEIRFPGGYTVHLQDPPAVTIGRTHIVFSDPLRIETHIGPAWLRLADDVVAINDLSTANTPPVWYRFGAAPYGDDRTRHRLLHPGDELWRYEYARAGSLLAFGSLEVFALDHAVGDNDPEADPERLPAWCSWYDAAGGRPVAGDAYYQTRVCWKCNGSGDCPTCQGSGEDGGRRCGDCGGSGDCSLCRRLDHDEDGLTDIRAFLQETWPYRGSPGLDEPDRQTALLPDAARPLVLTDDFFRWGLNVAVWREAEPALLGQFFANPEWGSFAVASARAGFWEEESQAFRYRFTDPAARAEWLAGYANSYQPDWEARLDSVRQAIYSWDIDADAGDSGASYLLRGLRDTAWRRDYLAVPDGRAARAWGATGVDWDSREVEDALDH